MVCWKCRESVQGPVCVSCGSIQPPSPKPDYFKILGIERRYFLHDVDEAHRNVSRKVHPDRFTRRSAVERRMSLQWTAAINEAKRVLKDPIRRARYLATGLSEAPEEGGVRLDPDFLEEIFELQMRLSSETDEVIRSAKTLHDQLMGSLTEIFKLWENESGKLGEVEEILARLKYINNIIQHSGGKDGQHRH